MAPTAQWYRALGFHRRPAWMWAIPAVVAVLRCGPGAAGSNRLRSGRTHYSNELQRSCSLKMGSIMLLPREN